MAATATRRAPRSSGSRLIAYDRDLGAPLVGGADEAGRGALAGPLVAAGVLLRPAAISLRLRRRLALLDDSKRLTAARREELLPTVLEAAERVRLVVVAPAAVDSGGVHRANLAALRRALEGIDPGGEVELLSDGFALGAGLAHRAVVRGDATSAAIAAASIVAKVLRDRLMRRAGEAFPVYGFAQHAGYGTAQHLGALRLHGPCALHRMSFAPCAQTALPLA